MPPAPVTLKSRSIRIALIGPDPRHAEPVDRVIFAGGHGSHPFIASEPLLANAASQFFGLLLTGSWAGDRPAEAVIPRARSVLPDLPVIMLMSVPHESEIVAALHAGADDCLLKPVRGPEVPARVEALLRGAALRRPPSRRPDTFGGYAFDAAHFTVTFPEQTVALTPKEFCFALLPFIGMSRPASRVHILETVWGRTRDVRSRTPGTHASRVCTRLRQRPGRGHLLGPLYGYGSRPTQSRRNAPWGPEAAAELKEMRKRYNIGLNHSPAHAASNDRNQSPHRARRLARTRGVSARTDQTCTGDLQGHLARPRRPQRA